MDNTWSGLIGVVIGVVLASLLTIVRELWHDSRARKKQAEYLAIRVSCILDKFTDGCVEVVGDDGLSHGQTDEQGCCVIQTTTPQLDFQKLDVNWQSLPSDLMYEILNFPNKLDNANHIISGTFEYAAFPPDYAEGFEDRQYHYSILGLSSADLAERLRLKYNLPRKNYDDWNPLEYMVKHKETIIKLRDRRSKAHAAQLKKA